MVYISYNNLWGLEFDNIVSKKDKVQDIIFNHLKLEVHDTYKKDEKRTTNFEPLKDKDVINKLHLDERLLELNGHI